MKPNVLAAELWAEGPSAPVPLRRDLPAAGVKHAALRREHVPPDRPSQLPTFDYAPPITVGNPAFYSLT